VTTSSRGDVDYGSAMRRHVVPVPASKEAWWEVLQGGDVVGEWRRCMVAFASFLVSFEK